MTKTLGEFDNEYMAQLGEDLRLDRQTMFKYVTWMVARFDFIKNSTDSQGCEHVTNKGDERRRRKA